MTKNYQVNYLKSLNFKGFSKKKNNKTFKGQHLDYRIQPQPPPTPKSLGRGGCHVDQGINYLVEKVDKRLYASFVVSLRWANAPI